VAQVGEYYERTSPYDVPNYDTIAIYRWFQAQGNTMILWSGGGVDYARTWGEKLGLQPFEVILKDKKGGVDIAFDDCDVDLATVNVKVKRLNNSISRAEWNKGGSGEGINTSEYNRGIKDGRHEHPRAYDIGYKDGGHDALKKVLESIEILAVEFPVRESEEFDEGRRSMKREAREIIKKLIEG
jgi:hypothetical protein